jgi:glycosyltransferase involved in cell wall biosynthesis
MKILLTVHQFLPQYSAGTEVLTYSVARELIRRGHMAHVLTGHPSSADLREEDRFDEYDFEGIHVYRFHHAYTPMGGQISMIEIDYNNRLAATYFGRVLERFKPDVVHFFHLNRLGIGLIEQAVRMGIPCFMTPTDFWLICPTGQLVLGNGSLCSGPSAHAGNCVKHFAQSTQKGIVGRVAEWLPTAGADFLVRLTQKGVLPSYPRREEVMATASRLGINIARLNQLRGLIVPNAFMGELLILHGVFPSLIIQSAFGIDITPSEGNERRSIPRHPLRVGFIGTLAPHKGCHVLIDAFKTLPPGRAVLLIYGNMEDFPEYSAELKRLADNNDAIAFCGTFHNSKIGEILSDFDVLVVPSLWYENTPLVVYSAQLARCPVVASDFPGISEVIRDHVNGLLFEPGRPAGLAKQLSRLINEPGLAERLSINSQQPKSTAIYVDELLSLWAGRE